MKKIVFMIIVFGICCDAGAKWGPNFGSGDSCVVEYKGAKRRFHFCGKSQDECAGKKVRKYSEQHTHLHGGGFVSEVDGNRKFYCCNPNNADKGRFVEGKSWLVGAMYTEAKQLADGTCNVAKRLNICGDAVVVTDCSEPDDCPDGTILRNNECVVPCDEGSVFESEESNRCIQCETTRYQGIDNTFKCIKCDRDVEWWDDKNKECVKKSDYTKISRDAMQQCYMCPNNITFQECVWMLSMSQEYSVEKQHQIKADCDLN